MLSAVARQLGRATWLRTLSATRTLSTSSPACTAYSDDTVAEWDDGATPWVRTLINGVDILQRKEVRRLRWGAGGRVDLAASRPGIARCCPVPAPALTKYSGACLAY